MRQQQSGNHLDDSEELSVLDDEQVVLADLAGPLVHWPVARIHTDNRGQGLNECDRLEEEERNLANALTAQGHRIVDDGELELYLHENRRAVEHLDQVLLAL